MMTPCDEPPPATLIAGIAQFNRGEYFEQHETLEALWRAEPRPVRALYQGILQIGVAFHHLARGNYHGAVTMLRRGLAHLQPFRPMCQQVDVEALVGDARRALDALEVLGPDRLDRFDRRLVVRVRLLDRG